MFLGRHYHSLELKGRLAIPSTFRKQLGKKPIITRGLDGCLFLLPSEVWTRLTRQLGGSPLTKQDTRDFVRLIAHDAQVVTFDPQGRTLINKTLREYAQIKKSVVVAGSIDWIEIWDQDKYHTRMTGKEKHAEAIAERLTEIATKEKND